MSILVCAALAAAFTNSFARLEFASDGRLASLTDVESGIDLADPATPFVEVRRADGSAVFPDSLSLDGSMMTFGFPGGLGKCVLKVSPFDGGWTFETVSMSVADAERLVFARVTFPRACKKGHISNVLMDAHCAVAVRGYTPDVEMHEHMHQTFYDPADRTSYAAVSKENGFVGKRAGLSAGSRGRIIDMLKGMSRAAGVPTAGCGGAWSLESEANRSSYLFAIWMDENSVDDFIDLAHRAGCQMLHLHGWYRSIGHYDVDRGCYPNGLESVAAVVSKIHAAGLKASFHTLSAAVQFGDEWITPEWFDDFQTDAEYTLSRPYRRGDTTLYVNERPWSGHAKILTGSTNGNLLRLGDDLLQYDDFSQVPPYSFSGIRMALAPYGEEDIYDDTQALDLSGAFDEKTGGRARRQLSRAEYACGTRVSYLHQRYGEFFPRPGSRLAEKATDAIAAVFNTCKFDGIYLDGAEGFNSRESVDAMRMRIIEKLHPPPAGIVNSTSCRNPFNWWFRSLIGSFDHPNYGVKSYHDRHISVYKDILEADLLATDLGWWNIKRANANGRGYFADEVEYFGCKSAANDSTVSIMSRFFGDEPMPFAEERLFTLTGWCMKARYARALRPELMERMKEPGKEFRIRQSSYGEWRVAPFKTMRRRVATADNLEWTASLCEPASALVRIEALYGADLSAAKTNTIRLVDASMIGQLVRSSADGVEMSCGVVHDAEHGDVIRLAAVNRSAPSNASWVCLGRHFDVRDVIAVNPVSSLWVKGDGSGAILNVQVRKHPGRGEAGCSENFVKLDFTGWRRFDLLLRERDADESSAYEWPYENKLRLNTPAGVFRAVISGKCVGELNFWLNGIRPGASATIELGSWDSLPQGRNTLEGGAFLEVAGRRVCRLPFDLRSGEYAELDKDGWTHYSEGGEPVERVACAVLPFLPKGETVFALRQRDGFCRAEVTLFPSGRDEPAFVVLSKAQRELLAEEYELPRKFDPTRGFGGSMPVRVRPGESARLGFEILGPVKNPSVNGRRMDVVLANEFERVVCRDGRTWRAVRWIPGETSDDTHLRVRMTQRQVFASGAFDRPLVLVGGTSIVELSADETDGARVNFVKRYDSPPAD